MSNISRIQKAGELDRRIQLLGLTYTKVKGEARRTYSQIFTLAAAKDPQGGTETVKAGAVTSVSGVVWRIFYNTEITTETPGYEAMIINEVVYAPVYLRDFEGNIMYDFNGHPMIDMDDTNTILYDIKDIQEVGRRVAMDLICERWR